MFHDDFLGRCCILVLGSTLLGSDERFSGTDTRFLSVWAMGGWIEVVKTFSLSGICRVECIGD